GVGERREDLVEPGGGGGLEVGLAVGARRQASGAEFFETLIEPAAVAAEVVVGGVTEGQNGVTEVVQAGGRGGEGVPEAAAIVGRLAVTEGAGDEEGIGGGQVSGVGVVHAEE